MFRSPVMLAALVVTGAIALWGLVDAEGLAAFAGATVGQLFQSRGWFIMLTATSQLIACVVLALSRYGRVKLGADDDEPEFSTVSWLTMLFAAGMGVGLLYFGAAEPLSHYMLLRDFETGRSAATGALFLTNFHWGLHAWGIYGLTALVIAYFGFRKGCPTLVSAPIRWVFGTRPATRLVGGACDLLAIVAIAIGLGGSVAMGVFQVQGGIESMLGLESSGVTVTATIFVALVVAYIVPLTVDLGRGMAVLSNTAMAIALALMVFVLLAGPTHALMGGIVEAVGQYADDVIPHGLRTFTFMDERVTGYFGAWTLTYMVWWLAWAPFVGVFIARISRGRTIREFVVGVILVPTLFSVFWFGIFGGLGFWDTVHGDGTLLTVVAERIDATTFVLLGKLPLALLTQGATVAAAFLFIVTSVVSAAFVLAMFSTAGDLDPPVKVKLIWGVILGLLGLVMILSGSLDAVRSIIALGAMPFVFIVLLLLVCLLKALRREGA